MLLIPLGNNMGILNLVCVNKNILQGDVAAYEFL